MKGGDDKESVNTKRHLYLSPPPDGYCSLTDELGCEAYSGNIDDEEDDNDEISGFLGILRSMNRRGSAKRNGKGLSSSSLPCIRLQAELDPSLRDVHSTDDVLRKIVEARTEQSRKGDARLYDRTWVPLSSSSTGAPTNPNQTFTLMQFNALAEGLSSGPHVKTPFRPSASHASNVQAFDKSKVKDGGSKFYGGFNQIPHPNVILDFALRKWRLLEVLLGGGCHKSTDESSAEPNGASAAVNGEGKDLKFYNDADLFDIITMEEIDRFHGFFHPAMTLFGYDGLFAPKPRAPGVHLGWYSDGCAIFFRTSRFHLVSHMKGSYNVGNQIYLVATLKHRETGQHVVVAVTHLKAQKSESTERIRTAQLSELVHVVTSFVSSELEPDHAADVPIIIAGDFNADHNGTCLTTALSPTDQQRTSFTSAYPVRPPSEAFFTTWKTRGDHTVRRIIDYILYSFDENFEEQDLQDQGKETCYENTVNGEKSQGGKSQGGKSATIARGGIRCTEVLNVPNEIQIEHTKLPGFRYPSDHMAIAAKFHLSC